MGKPKYLGQRVSSHNYGDFDVIGWENGKYIVQFVNTGSIKTISTANLTAGYVRDNYMPIRNGIGYLGDMSGKASSHPMLSTWEKLIQRCANNEHEYSLESLCPQWHNFTVFAEEVSQIPFYTNRIKEGGHKWNLDKDLLGYNFYSKNTCLWVPQEINVQVAGIYKMQDIGFEIKFPSKETVIQYIENNFTRASEKIVVVKK